MPDNMPEVPTIGEQLERLKALAAVGRTRGQAGAEPLTDGEKIEAIEIALDVVGSAFIALSDRAASAERIADALEVANEYTVDARSTASAAARLA